MIDEDVEPSPSSASGALWCAFVVLVIVALFASIGGKLSYFTLLPTSSDSLQHFRMEVRTVRESFGRKANRENLVDVLVKYPFDELGIAGQMVACMPHVEVVGHSVRKHSNHMQPIYDLVLQPYRTIFLAEDVELEESGIVAPWIILHRLLDAKLDLISESPLQERREDVWIVFRKMELLFLVLLPVFGECSNEERRRVAEYSTWCSEDCLARPNCDLNHVLEVDSMVA